MKNFFLLLLLFFPHLAWSEWVVHDDAIMGSNIRLQIWAENKSKGGDLIKTSLAILEEVDRRFSNFKSDSELSQLNALAYQQSTKVSDDLFFLLEQSIQFSELSGGAFDISVASVSHLYEYRQQKKPDDKTIAELLPAINYRAIELDKVTKTVHFKYPEMQLDLGGIAKGYAVDNVISYLKKQGVVAAMVTAGGDSYILGDKQGEPWLVGIKNPDDRKTAAIILPLGNTAISTSGDYERFFIDSESGQRYHHIINPHTGKSPLHTIRSVSVIGETTILTDALSTTVFVLGPEEGMALVNRLPDIEAIILTASGDMLLSDGLMQPERAGD